LQFGTAVADLVAEALGVAEALLVALGVFVVDADALEVGVPVDEVGFESGESPPVQARRTIRRITTTTAMTRARRRQ